MTTPKAPAVSGELLPCPFCGGEADRVASMGESWVRCMTCNAGTEMFGTDTSAITAWNTRAHPQPSLSVGLDRARLIKAMRENITIGDIGSCSISLDGFEDAADRILALAAPAEGYVLVPVEPTEAMLMAARGLIMSLSFGVPNYQTSLSDVARSGYYGEHWRHILTDEELAMTGPITKGHRSQLIYRAMIAACLPAAPTGRRS